MNERECLHALESLAQQLYEESEPDGTPWARRGRVIREAWLTAARRMLEAPKPD